MDIWISVPGDCQRMGEDGCRVGAQKGFVLVYLAEFLENGGTREGKEGW